MSLARQRTLPGAAARRQPPSLPSTPFIGCLSADHLNHRQRRARLGIRSTTAHGGCLRRQRSGTAGSCLLAQTGNSGAAAVLSRFGYPHAPGRGDAGVMTQFTPHAVPAQYTEADGTPSASGRVGITATPVRALHQAAGLFRGGKALAPKPGRGRAGLCHRGSARPRRSAGHDVAGVPVDPGPARPPRPRRLTSSGRHAHDMSLGELVQSLPAEFAPSAASAAEADAACPTISPRRAGS